MKPARGRISLRDQMIKNQATLDLYASLAGKPRMNLPIPPAPVKRAPSVPSGVPLERDVLKTIIAGLRIHPMIGLVERVNSGSAVETNADGSQRHIQFHHVYSVAGQKMRSVDVHCTLTPSGKRFVVEVKRQGWSRPKDQREEEQVAYIQHVRACGGHGMVATSWDEVQIELKRIHALLHWLPR